MLIKYGYVCYECILGCLYFQVMGRAIGLGTHFDPRFICAVNMMSILCHKISQEKGTKYLGNRKSLGCKKGVEP